MSRHKAWTNISAKLIVTHSSRYIWHQTCYLYPTVDSWRQHRAQSYTAHDLLSPTFSIDIPVDLISLQIMTSTRVEQFPISTGTLDIKPCLKFGYGPSAPFVSNGTRGQSCSPRSPLHRTDVFSSVRSPPNELPRSAVETGDISLENQSWRRDKVWCLSHTDTVCCRSQ